MTMFTTGLIYYIGYIYCKEPNLTVNNCSAVKGENGFMSAINKISEQNKISIATVILRPT